MAEMLETLVNINTLFSGQSKVAQASAAMQKLAEKTKSLQSASKNIVGFQKMASTLDANRQKLDAARAKVKQLGEQIRASGGKDSPELQRAFTAANKEAARLQETVQNNMHTLGELRNSLQGAGVDVSHLADAQRRLQTETDRTAAAQQRLSQAEARYGELRQKLSWGNIKTDIIQSAATVMAFQKPIQVDMEFEQAMANVHAVAPMTGEEFTSLREQSIMLGSTTQFSATQAAQSQESLARAGFSVNEIMQTMPGLLDMAAAEGLDLAQAADILAGGLRGMNLPMSDTGRLADTLAYTSAHSKTSIAMLGEAFKAVAATAAMQKVKPEQLASYLGVMANMNVEGSEAGNALKSAFMRLAKPPTESLQYLKKFGVAVKTSKGEMRELPDILKELYTKTQNLGSMGQLDVFSTIFGKNYGDSIIKLTQGVMNGAHADLEGGLFNKKQGSSHQMALTRNDTLKGDIVSLGSAWEGLMIRIGNAFDPINRMFTQNLTEWIQGINEFIDAHKPLVDIALRVGYALAGWMIVKRVWHYGKLAIDTFRAWHELKLAEHAANLLTMGDNAATIAANLGAAASAGGNFKSLMVTLAGPMGVLVAASLAIALNWEAVTGWCKKAGEAIKNFDTNKITAAKEGTLKRSDPDYGLAVMTSTYAIPSLKPQKKHAAGGILTRPHIGLVAEAGPEAIIPLTDKTRGMSLLERVAGVFGMSVSPEGKTQKKEKISSLTPQSANFSQIFSVFSPERSPSFSRVDSLVQSVSSFFGGNSDSSTTSSLVQSVSSFFGGSDNSSASSHFIEQAGDFIAQRTASLPALSGHSGLGSPSRQAQTLAPQISIIVNSAPNEDPQGLAERIAQAMQDALREITSYEERVAFA